MQRLKRLSIGDVLLATAAGIGVVHHVDHVLRFDHSGWPFKSDVNEFTFSLAAYPIIALALWAPRRSFARVVLAFLAFLGPTAAHVFIETPAHQHYTWASHPEINLLGISSPFLGGLAGTVSVALSTVALTAVVACAREWRRERS